jgi:hypothetical protein
VHVESLLTLVAINTFFIYLNATPAIGAFKEIVDGIMGQGLINTMITNPV